MFFIGFNIATKIKNNEPIEMKEIIPTIPFPKQEEPDTKEIERIKTIYENIDSYNGTGMGQKELP